MGDPGGRRCQGCGKLHAPSALVVVAGGPMDFPQRPLEEGEYERLVALGLLLTEVFPGIPMVTGCLALAVKKRQQEKRQEKAGRN